MPRVRSRYAEIWEQVKKHGYCTVTTAERYHKRLRKAVIKRKDEDLVYKLECAEVGTRYTLATAVAGAEITFTLTRNYGVQDL